MIKYNQTTNLQSAAEISHCNPHTIKRGRDSVQIFRTTGGDIRDSIAGFDQILLCMSTFVYTYATADQLCVFIQETSGDIYIRHQVSDMCYDLKVTRKRGPKEAFNASLPLV